MKNVKRILCGMMAVMMIMCLVACGSDSEPKGSAEDIAKVEAFVEREGEGFVYGVESSSNGAAEADMKADGTKVVIEISSANFNGATKQSAGQIADQMESASNMLKLFQGEEPAISAVVIKLYDGNGKMLVSKTYK